MNILKAYILENLIEGHTFIDAKKDRLDEQRRKKAFVDERRRKLQGTVTIPGHKDIIGRFSSAFDKLRGPIKSSRH